MSTLLALLARGAARTGRGLPLALLLSACGATQLSPKFAPPPTPGEAEVARNISKAEARSERPVVVAVRADGAALCAWDLTGAPLWELPVRASAAPLVVGDAVLSQEADRIAIYDLATGKLRLSLDGSGQLVGADGIGNRLALSVAYKEADGSGHGELVFVVDDSVRWEKALSQPAGTPALVSNQVLVPWGTQRLSVLSADDGNELARWTFRNTMMGQALVERGQVYVGQLGLLRVDPALPDHQEGPITLIAPAKRVLPGQPPLLRDGYAVLPPPSHASHKIRLEWRPSDAGPQVDGDTALLRFYRLAFGLSAQEDAVTWARVFEHEQVGSSALPGGFLLVDDQGSLRFVDDAGVTRMKVELGKPLQAATIRAGSFVAPPQTAKEGIEGPSATLHDQLLAATQLSDDRMTPARAFAVQHLAKTQDASVTRELIALCTRHGASKNALQLSACNELGRRTGNPSDILEALREKASFLEDTSAPPVGALAQAAAHMQLKQAGPSLLAHAEDPHTEASDLPALFQALEKLDYQAAVPQLERFVRLHHAEPDGSDLGPALSAALSALGNLRAKSVRGTLEKVANDGLSLASAQKSAQDALIMIERPVPARETPKAEKVREKAKVGAPTPEPQTDPRPHALDAEAIQKTFRPLQAALEHCLEADPAQPKSARIAMIVAGDGRMEGFFVTPTSLQGCSDAILRTAHFPETRLTRQHVIQTVYARDPAEPRAPASRR
jgi:hypothetical protein